MRSQKWVSYSTDQHTWHVSESICKDIWQNLNCACRRKRVKTRDFFVLFWAELLLHDPEANCVVGPVIQTKCFWSKRNMHQRKPHPISKCHTKNLWAEVLGCVPRAVFLHPPPPFGNSTKGPISIHHFELWAVTVFTNSKQSLQFYACLYSPILSVRQWYKIEISDDSQFLAIYFTTYPPILGILQRLFQLQVSPTAQKYIKETTWKCSKYLPSEVNTE